MALCDACEKKENLIYAEPALNLVDKLLSKKNSEEVRDNLFAQEQGLLYSVVAYYTNNDTTNWNKVELYNEARLKSIEKTGNQKRTAEFLFHIAAISLDGKKDSAMFFTNMYKSLAIFNELDSIGTVSPPAASTRAWLRIRSITFRLKGVGTR